MNVSLMKGMFVGSFGLIRKKSLPQEAICKPHRLMFAPCVKNNAGPKKQEEISMDLNGSERLYYTNTYLFNAKAKLTHVGKDEKGTFALFDQTIFHPQGGGQPADTGVVEINDASIPVSHVREVEDQIRHYGDFFETSHVQPVSMTIHAAKRQLYAKLHSGGHLLAHAVEETWLGSKGVKGYHFPDGPYVEFIHEDPSATPPPHLIEQVNERLEQDIQKADAVAVSFANESGSAKSARRVQFGDKPLTPCGGTHVDNVEKLKGLQATKAKFSKSRLKVSYRFVE